MLGRSNAPSPAVMLTKPSSAFLKTEPFGASLSKMFAQHVDIATAWGTILGIFVTRRSHELLVS
jgi:hypothetical protein